MCVPIDAMPVHFLPPESTPSVTMPRGIALTVSTASIVGAPKGAAYDVVPPLPPSLSVSVSVSVSASASASVSACLCLCLCLCLYLSPSHAHALATTTQPTKTDPSIVSSPCSAVPALARMRRLDISIRLSRCVISVQLLKTHVRYRGA